MPKHNLVLGDSPDGEPVGFPIDALRRHAVVLGSSGSGKTVLSKVLVEECVRSQLPVVAVDPQGDLASLALAGDEATLRKMGVNPRIAEQFFDVVEPVIWTPGASYGRPLSFMPKMSVGTNLRHEDRIRAFGAVGQSLAAMVGDNNEATPVAFSMILEYADEFGLACDTVGDLCNFLADPPPMLARRLEPIFDDKTRKRAQKAFMVKTLGPNRLLFDLGEPIDPDELFGLRSNSGKTRLSVIYLNTLTSQADKDLFVALLAGALYQWMLTLDGQHLWGMFYMDEMAPYLPPVKNPPAKQGLMLLLRQARKYGLCCLMATQSPGDLDYKALGQMGTWALGRIQGERALSKVAPVLRAQPNLDTEAILDELPGLPKGRFVLVNPDHFESAAECQVRWLVTDHRVLTPEEVETISR